jgi:UDPglucose 6-dehydrogenase
MSREKGCDAGLLNAVLDTNAKMRAHVLAKLTRHLGSLEGKTIGVLGLAFKPETDDIRESPALALIQELLASGAKVKATDPAAGRSSTIPGVQNASDGYGVAMGADVIILATEWPAFLSLNFERIANAMRGDLIIDGRNALDSAVIEEAGLVYEGIGRATRRTPFTPQIVQVDSIIISPISIERDASAAD